jgi:hypothetical protein
LKTIVDEQEMQSSVQEITKVKKIPQRAIPLVRVPHQQEPAATVAPAQVATQESCLDLAALFLARG